VLQRAASAIDTITSSRVYRDGVVDRSAVRMALARQRRDIEGALREQARLRARQADVPGFGAGAATAEVEDSRGQATHLAEPSLAARVDALERYAAEIREADAAYRESPPTGQLSEKLAQTAAEEYRIAELGAMSQQARAVRLALRQPRPSEPEADPALQADPPDPPA
jgi:hypothetical protein